jgi:hypothetical protein
MSVAKLTLWQTMNKRDYHDPASKSVCMAECLSPKTVSTSNFYTVFVPSQRVEEMVNAAASELKRDIDVVVNEYMFLK